MVKSSNNSGSNNGSQVSTVDSAPILTTKASIMRALNKEIPLNKDYQLPEYIFRADLIPEDVQDMDSLERDTYLNNAIVELDYDQGFPTLPNAEPFWSKLQCEGLDAFKAFTAYLDMPRPPKGEAQPVRQLHMLKALTNQSIDMLLSFSHLYYWNQRAVAYDAFVVASHAKMKEHRLLAAEAQHYEMSTRFIAETEQLLMDKLNDPYADVSAKEVLDVLKFMIQTQRLSLGVAPFSVGLPANVAPPMNQSLEVIMRTLTKTSSGADGIRTISAQDSTKKLFENPEDLAIAQELIIKLQDQNDPRKAKQLTFEDHIEE